MNPASHLSPKFLMARSTSSRSGGTLAGAPSIGHFSSLGLFEPADDFRAHDANRHHPGWPGGKTGAAGASD